MPPTLLSWAVGCQAARAFLLATFPRMPCGPESDYSEMISILSNVYSIHTDHVYRNMYHYIFILSLPTTMINVTQKYQFMHFNPILLENGGTTFEVLFWQITKIVYSNPTATPLNWNFFIFFLVPLVHHYIFKALYSKFTWIHLKPFLNLFFFTMDPKLLLVYEWGKRSKRSYFLKRSI